MNERTTMNKHIPAAILAITCLALATGLFQSNRKIASLEQKITELQKAPAPRTPKKSPLAASRKPDPRELQNKPIAQGEPQHGKEPITGKEEEEESPNRKMMANLSKMMDNPAMTEVMEASQRGALKAMYGDMIESLELNKEEAEYFMDLLMSRQMKNVELGMKMMSGELSKEEKAKLGEELAEVQKTVKTEMEKFLNDEEDFAEFEFYEKTMGERMMLSQMDQKLAATDAGLNDETRRALLEMMHDERKNHDFQSTLHDNENMDLSADRFSEEKVKQFSEDMDALNQKLVSKAGALLATEQLAAFEESVQTMAEMQKSQMEMTANMLRGKK